VNDCQALIQTLKGYENMSEPTKPHPTKLFRPPYGQIRPSQIRSLKNQGYNIIQWSLLSCDYDPNLNINRSLSALKKGTEAGSIVVFHDSEKAENQLKQLLWRYLDFISEIGFVCRTL
jgi:peptidoglycan/xylan/chitin deacetylase (PgdA/CDA1 family)